MKKSLISIARTGGTSCDRDILVEHSISVRNVRVQILEKEKLGTFVRKKRVVCNFYNLLLKQTLYCPYD